MKYAPYSFSKINLYEQCPLKFKFNYIDKLGTFYPNLATERGSFIHTLLENHTKEKKTKFKFLIATEEEQKDCFNIFVEFLDSDLGKKYMVNDAKAELNFGMKKTKTGLEVCKYGDKQALFRGKIDHSILEEYKMHLADWKTGKVSFFPAPLQLMMYMVWAFYKYPELEEVITSFVYVEHLQEKEYKFTREHLNPSIMKILGKILNIEKDTTFLKKEGPLCNFCDFRTAGLCLPETHDEFEQKMMQYTKKDKK